MEPACVRNHGSAGIVLALFPVDTIKCVVAETYCVGTVRGSSVVDLSVSLVNLVSSPDTW